MLNFLPSSIQFVLSFCLYIINVFIFGTSLIPFIILKAIIPIPVFRKFMTLILTTTTTTWAIVNSYILLFTKKMEWDIQIEGEYSKKKSYMVISNHQSWVDIFALQEVLNTRIPYFRFFMKDNLKWLPILGIVWWGLDYPFMKRYSKKFIEKNPHLKGKDIEATKKACERFKNGSVAIVNFPEGTRFTKEKHQKQKSPYKNLLLPKAGGVAIALSALEGQLTSILDVTIIYNKKEIGFKSFLNGKMKKITVIIKQIEIDKDFTGDYINDLEFKKNFQTRMNTIWKEKDELITQYYLQHNKNS